MVGDVAVRPGNGGRNWRIQFDTERKVSNIFNCKNVVRCALNVNPKCDYVIKIGCIIFVICIEVGSTILDNVDVGGCMLTMEETRQLG